MIGDTAPRTMAQPTASDNVLKDTFGRSAMFVALIVSYRIALDVSYLQVAEAFEYQGLFHVYPSTSSHIVSWVLLLLMLPVFKRVFDNATPSGNILSLLILFSVIPCIVLISYRSDYPASYIALMFGFWFLIFAIWLLSKPNYIKSGSLLESKNFYIIAATALSAVVVIYSYLNTGLRLHFDFINVYDIRAEAREFTAPGGINYVIALADNILPVLAIVFLVQKRWVAFGVMLIIIFVNFSITGTKQILFVPLLGIIGYYGVRDFTKTYRFIAAAIALCILSIVERAYFGSMSLHTIYAYRVLFIPAELHYGYYSYFQLHDLLYYSQSLLKIYTVADQENIQFVIGEFTIGDFTARANNGLFSDAYMNLGIIGVVLYPLIIVGYLRILDGSIYGLPQRIIFVVTVYVAFVLLGMTLTSAFLTSGLLFLVILLYSIPRDLLRRRTGAPSAPAAQLG